MQHRIVVAGALVASLSLSFASASCATVASSDVVDAPPVPLAVPSLVAQRDAKARELDDEEGTILLARIGVGVSAALVASAGVEGAVLNGVAHVVDPKLKPIGYASAIGFGFGGLALGLASTVVGISADHTDAARAELTIAQRRLDLEATR